RRLCTRAVLLEAGRVALDGGVDEVIAEYVKSAGGGAAEYIHAADTGKPVVLRRVALLDHEQQLNSEVQYGEGFAVQVEYEVREPVDSTIVWVGIRTRDGIAVFDTCDYDLHPELLAPRA